MQGKGEAAYLGPPFLPAIEFRLFTTPLQAARSYFALGVKTQLGSGVAEYPDKPSEQPLLLHFELLGCQCNGNPPRDGKRYRI